MLDYGLYIVATPIGNLQDISQRALAVLRAADIIACEDTRVSRKLFSLLGLDADKPFICYQDHNEEQKAPDIAEFVRHGKSVALISDAGSPLISDPGYRLVRCFREQGLPLQVVPGPSAVISALQISGLPTNRFMFAGFIPNKDKARKDLFNELKNINTTLVFYETAPRLVKTLQAAEEIFKGRQAAVAREITKLFEECRADTCAGLAAYFEQNPPKGEIVLMIAPPEEPAKDGADLRAELEKRIGTMSLKSAVKEVAELSGCGRNEIYALALELKK